MKICTVVLFGVAVIYATPALGQMQAMPVYFSPKGGTGLTIDGDLGRVSDNRVSGTSTVNHPTAIGGRAYLGLGKMSLGVGASVYDTKILNQVNATQYMASAAFNVLGGPLVPIAVSVQAGAGYMKFGSGTGATRTVSAPVGMGFALNIPTPGFALEPWAAARVQVNSISTGGGSSTVSQTRIGYGLSGGINVGLPIGLGLHAGADWSVFGANTTSLIPVAQQKQQLLTIGLGVHYMIKLPGLPGIHGPHV
jgi:hypothetical protein